MRLSNSTQLNSHEENCTFINDLIETTRKDDEDLKKFIDDNLYPKISKLSIETINKNVSELQKMTVNQQVLVKGRARSFEDSNDPSKFFPSLLAILGIVFSLYALLREVTNSSWGTVLASILIISFFAIYATRLFTKTTKRRSTAVFFTALLDSINFKEK